MKSIDDVAAEECAAALSYAQFLCGSEVRLFRTDSERTLIATTRSERGQPLKPGRSKWIFQSPFADPDAQSELFESDCAFILEFDRGEDREIVFRRLRPADARLEERS
jgi:hypothetical protein